MKEIQSQRAIDKTVSPVGTTVAMVTYNWLSSGGGVSKYVFTLTSRLQKQEGLRVTVVAADPRAAERGVDVSGEGIGLAWNTLKALWRIRPDVIHCHGHIWMGAASAFYKWLRGHRSVLIYTMHTKLDSPEKELSRLSSVPRLVMRVRLAIRRALHAVIIRQCDTVTAVSKAMADDLMVIERVKPRTTIEIIPPGVEISEPHLKEVQSFREQHQLIGKFPIIVSIGIFHHDWKVEGHKRLISALVILRKQYPCIRLIIVGDGRLRERVERYVAEVGACDEVIFTGYLDSPGLALAVADVYGHLALNEAFGIAIVEAMLYRKPVVAANAGGIPEVIEHQKTGVLVDPKPDAVAGAIQWVLEDARRGKRLGERARRVALTSYTWASAADRFVALYRGTAAVAEEPARRVGSVR
ncbi:MAG TPA: glycosyltransferase family 4 protein [Nitrospiria bacterium]|nr:glycosyltransferase family 4 protein [Nitrospiria bacterium]